MKKILIIIICAVVSFATISAQEMTVKSFYHDPSDKSAVNNPRIDFNGNKCALIVVDIDVPLMKFYGNIIGETERHKGKYYVYMTTGSKKLKVQHPDLTPLVVNFSEFEVGSVSSDETYMLNISLPDIAKNSSFAADINDTSRPKHLSLMCVKDNKPVYFTKTQWNNLPDKASYNISGLVIIDREEQFIIALEDYGRYTEDEIRPYLTELPTEGQVQAIIDDLSNIQDALEFFGGEKLNYSYYMALRSDNELGLGDTDLSWKFAREMNTLRSWSNVRPASTRLDIADPNPFKLPVSPSKIRDQISAARSKKDYKEAIRVCMSIPEDPVAQYYLGVMYENGQGVDQDYAEAMKWYKKGADQEDGDCQYELGRLYQYGIGVDQNYSEAVKWYKKAGDNNEAYAQTALGFMYLNGQGVDKNLDEAVKYLTKASERGMTDAQNCLGWMYEYGNGVEKNEGKAIELYKEAAENGHVNAQINLGLLYYNGKGTPVDYSQAFNWWLKAAEQGNTTAQCNIGVLYKLGQGVEQDYNKAIEWYKKAVEAGDPMGENNLGYSYLKGEGVPVNYDEALRLFRSSADKGNSEAQYSLGEMYENGQGVPISLDDAKEWYKKSADQGHEKAANALRRLNGEVVQTPVVREFEPEELKSDGFDNFKTIEIELYDEKLPLSIVSKGNKFGVYSKYGLELIPCKYDKIEWFSELKAFQVKDNNKYGILSFGGDEVIPIVMDSRPISKILVNLIPWYIETIYPTDTHFNMDEIEKRDVILMSFDGTPFYSFKYKKFMELNNLDKLIERMNSKFNEANKKANYKYSNLGEQKKALLDKINALYFNILQNERALRIAAHNGDEDAINTLKKVKLDNF